MHKILYIVSIIRVLLTICPNFVCLFFVIFFSNYQDKIKQVFNTSDKKLIESSKKFPYKSVALFCCIAWMFRYSTECYFMAAYIVYLVIDYGTTLARIDKIESAGETATWEGLSNSFQFSRLRAICVISVTQLLLVPILLKLLQTW